MRKVNVKNMKVGLSASLAVEVTDAIAKQFPGPFTPMYMGDGGEADGRPHFFLMQHPEGRLNWGVGYKEWAHKLSSPVKYAPLKDLNLPPAFKYTFPDEIKFDDDNGIHIYMPKDMKPPMIRGLKKREDLVTEESVSREETPIPETATENGLHQFPITLLMLNPRGVEDVKDFEHSLVLVSASSRAEAVGIAVMGAFKDNPGYHLASYLLLPEETAEPSA